MSEAPYPPAEPPADGDWTSQAPPTGPAARYAASASVPVTSASGSVPLPPATSPPPSSGGSYPAPAGPYGQPNTYGQANTYGQGDPYGGGGAPLGQPPAQSGPPNGPAPAGPPSASGHARVAASASVSMPQQLPPQAVPGQFAPPPPLVPAQHVPPQGYPVQAGVYGQSAGGQYGAPATASGQYGSATGGAGQPGFAGQPPATYGAMPPDRQAMAAPMGQGAYSPGSYGQPADPARPRESQGVPTGGWPYVEQSPAAPKSRRGLIITLIVLVVLVVVGVGGYVGWSLTNQGSTFVVGDCVKQEGGNAVAVECSTSGAYRVTSIVETENTCPDAKQPSLVLTERVGGARKFACLSPAG